MGFRRHHLICLLLFAAALGGLVPQAQAQEDKKASREREMLRRAQQALRQSEEQNAALQNEKAALEQKLAVASAKAEKLAAAEQQAQAAQKHASGLMVELAQARQAGMELGKKLADANAKFAQLSQEHTDALHNLSSRDSQLKLQQSTLTQVRAEVAACEGKNLKLYEYGDELMQRYRDKGVFDSLRQAEPLTGLKQAQIDNLLGEYRDKLDAQRVHR